jgi:ABC-type transport system substrate-binding protein
MRRLFRWWTLFVIGLLATFSVAGTAASASSRLPAKARAASGPHGSVTVLENSGLYGSWTGFDASYTTSFSGFGPWVLGALFDGELTQWKSGNWNIITILAGSYDPSTGFGLPLYFGPTTFFNGTKDPTLYRLLDEAQGTFNMKVRAKYYSQIFKYLSDQAYLPCLFAVPSYELTSKSVTGFSIRAGLGLVDWANVGVKGS